MSTSSKLTAVSRGTARFDLTMCASPIGSALRAKLFVAGMAFAQTEKLPSLSFPVHNSWLPSGRWGVDCLAHEGRASRLRRSEG
jgi:hypothetical protein